MKLKTTRALYDYWNTLRGDNPAPFRAQVDPANFRDALPQVFILQRDNDTSYPFRIAGTGICSHFGREFRGENFLSLWSPDEREGLESLLLSVTHDAAGAVLGIKCRTDHGRTVNMEVLLLPLKLKDNACTQVIGAITPFNPEFWLGHEPITSQAIESLRLLWPETLPAALLDTRRHSTVRPASPTPQRRRSDTENRPKLVVIEGGLTTH